MRSRYVVTNGFFRVRWNTGGDGGPIFSYPIEYSFQDVYDAITTSPRALNMTPYATQAEAEAEANSLAINQYQFPKWTESKTYTTEYRKAHVLARGCEPEDYIGISERIPHPQHKEYVRDLSTEENFKKGNCIRYNSLAVVEVVTDAKLEEKGVLNPQDILYIKSATLRDGNYKNVTYNFVSANNSYKNIQPNEYSAEAYIAILEAYKKGPLCGLFRTHKKAANKLIAEVKNASSSHVHLMGLFKHELRTRPTAGEYHQCVAALIEREHMRFKR